MFCPNCGTQLPDGSRFCSSCGSTLQEYGAPQVASTAYQYEQQKTAMRQSELSTLSDLIRHFGQKRDQYAEYDEVCEKVDHYARGAKSFPLVMGIILTVIAGYMLLMAAVAPRVDERIAVIVTGCLLLVPGIILLIIGIRNKVNNKRYFAYYQKRYAELSAELSEHYLAYGNCSLGSEYTNPFILEAIYNMIQSGRTDTAKESINQIINDANRRAVDQYLDQIQRQAAAINTQSKIGTVFLAARFFR